MVLVLGFGHMIQIHVFMREGNASWKVGRVTVLPWQDGVPLCKQLSARLQMTSCESVAIRIFSHIHISFMERGVRPVM